MITLYYVISGCNGGVTPSTTKANNQNLLVHENRLIIFLCKDQAERHKETNKENVSYPTLHVTCL